MCLAVPGRIVEISDPGDIAFRVGKVDFGGIRKEINLAYTPEAEVGKYVLVHVGFAISRVDEEEAHRTYEALKELDQLSELESPVVEEPEPDNGPTLRKSTQGRNGNEVS